MRYAPQAKAGGWASATVNGMTSALSRPPTMMTGEVTVTRGSCNFQNVNVMTHGDHALTVHWWACQAGTSPGIHST